jgi:hypothetical protein
MSTARWADSAPALDIMRKLHPMKALFELFDSLLSAEMSTDCRPMSQFQNLLSGGTRHDSPERSFRTFIYGGFDAENSVFHAELVEARLEVTKFLWFAVHLVNSGTLRFLAPNDKSRRNSVLLLLLYELCFELR